MLELKKNKGLATQPYENHLISKKYLYFSIQQEIASQE